MTKNFLLSFLLAVGFVGLGPPCVGAAVVADSSLRALQADANMTGTEAEEAFCPPCPRCENDQDQQGTTTLPPNGEEPLTLQILVVDSIGIINMVNWNARDYEEFTGGKVKIVVKKAPTMPALFEEIEQDARTGGSLFDAYFTNPVIMGTAATLGGFLDLTPMITGLVK